MKGRFPPALVLVLAICTPVLSLVPTLLGYLDAAPPTRVFMGFPFMPVDHYQYAAFIRQASEDGRFFMENLFTSEPQSGVYVMLYYWVLGMFSRVTGLSHVTTWDLFRVLGGALYIVTFWGFTTHYFEKSRERLTATVLFCFAGGLDWVVVLLRSMMWPGGVVLEEPYAYYWNWATFGSMYVPNWIWPAFLMTLAIHLLLRRPAAVGWAAAPILPILWFMHHHTAMVAYLTFGLIPLMPIIRGAATPRKIAWRVVKERIRLVFPAISSFAIVAVYLMWAGKDEVFRLNAAASLQWKIFFSPWWYPLSYGLLLPLAWFGIRRIASVETPAWDAVTAWLGATVFLAANPITGGAKYQFLVFPPLILLATTGFGALRERSPALRRWLRNPVVAVLLAACLFLNAPLSLLKDHGSEFDRRTAYAPDTDLAAMRWLAAQPRGVVLSSYTSGHLIPWLSGQRVFLGHWFMTLDPNAKIQNVMAFFAPTVPLAAKSEFLRRTGARYVYFGTEEARLGVLDPGLPVERVYDEGGVSIFRVRP